MIYECSWLSENEQNWEIKKLHIFLKGLSMCLRSAIERVKSVLQSLFLCSFRVLEAWTQTSETHRDLTHEFNLTALWDTSDQTLDNHFIQSWRDKTAVSIIESNPLYSS